MRGAARSCSPRLVPPCAGAPTRPRDEPSNTGDKLLDFGLAKLHHAKRATTAGTIFPMREILILFVHLIVTVARLAGPGGIRSVVAESVLVRHQLLILHRGRKRAPNLCTADRILAWLCALFIRPRGLFVRLLF